MISAIRAWISTYALMIAGVIALAGWAYGGMQTYRLAGAKQATAEAVSAHQTDIAMMQAAAAKQSEAFRAEEARRQTAQQENEDASQAKIRQLAGDLVVALGEHGRVLDYAHKLAAASRCASGNPAAVSVSKAASSPGDLLADMYGRTDAAAAAIAEYADRTRIAGEKCVADYGALKK